MVDKSNEDLGSLFERMANSKRKTEERPEILLEKLEFRKEDPSSKFSSYIVLQDGKELGTFTDEWAERLRVAAGDQRFRYKVKSLEESMGTNFDLVEIVRILEEELKERK